MIKIPIENEAVFSLLIKLVYIPISHTHTKSIDNGSCLAGFCLILLTFNFTHSIQGYLTGIAANHTIQHNKNLCVFYSVNSLIDRGLVSHFILTSSGRNEFRRHDDQRSRKVFVNTVPADGLAPSGARPSAGTVMANIWFCIWGRVIAKILVIYITGGHTSILLWYKLFVDRIENILMEKQRHS